MNSIFDNYSLAMWYMGDGSIDNKSSKLHTYGFGYNGNLDIAKFLNNKFNLVVKIAQSNKHVRDVNKSYYITFNVAESHKLSQLVSPHILPHFQYKLHPEFRTDFSLNPTSV